MKYLKIEVTRDYLEKILGALEDAKGLCEALGYKHTFNKDISKTKYYLKK